MADKIKKLVHPGAFIRECVIPSGMSVTDAAKNLGVGRPALSNLLNGKSSLSSEMALRLEKAFGADGQKLLELQAQYAQQQQRKEEKDVAVHTYVPTFLTIKARQINDWAAHSLEARQLLPVLLRKLVNSTGRELRKVDFPGYDNAERKGWDGLVEAGTPTPWIPEGKSGWEFGTSHDPRAKAEADYAARMASVRPNERAESTFIFITPLNWPGKAEWALSKEEANNWKHVRSYDASDLEQWLEGSLPAQVWLAEQLNLPLKGCKTLDQCWQSWSTASEPQMALELFAPSISAYRSTFKLWLEKPSERPFIVAADSKAEALAFLACIFQEQEILPSYKDLSVVIESADTLRALAASLTPFIPIVCTDEAERELASVYRRLHCIVVRPRNAVDSNPDIALDLLSHEGFKKALESMGIHGDSTEQLARESGSSPTILRRRLSKIDAIRVPQWARDAEIARSLIPMTLVGAWHTKSKADCEILSSLACRPYSEVEGGIARLLQWDDCPVWSAGQYRGVASKIDCLFAINKLMTEKDIDTFFQIARTVLSEPDPSLELPEDQRWAAGLYGKLRNYSAALREGICETLVILSVHGNTLFRNRIGMDIESRVALLVRRLLSPFTLDKLLSHDSDLPRYAEAAPDEFLRLLEEDLQQNEPVVLGILKPVESSIFGGCPRSGLLWALECLAWKPQNLSRVSAVLAQLSRTKINDNWANKPIASLQSIYRFWVPQTAALLEDRKKSLAALTKKYPDIGWQVCIAQFENRSQIGHYSYRPRWRSDASGAGQPLTSREALDFARKAVDLAIAWPTHDEMTLGDLVERLDGMPEECQTKVWDLIDEWSTTKGNDDTKAVLRERIRRFAFTRRSQRRGLKSQVKDRARETYVKLEPRSQVARFRWLFVNQWVDESSEEISNEDYDLSKYSERIHNLRTEAVKAIWAEGGFENIMALLAGSGAAGTVGSYTALCIQNTEDMDSFLQRCLSIDVKKMPNIDGFIQGFLQMLEATARRDLLTSLAKDTNADQIVRLFRCAPFDGETWRLLHQYPEDIRIAYWREVYPIWNRHTPSDLIELIDRLLEVNRPRAAFHVVHMDWKEIETSRLKRLLRALATTDAEPTGLFRLSSHDISAALQSLDGRSGVTPEDMAQLEFMFIGALHLGEHGIPNLERQIAEMPTMFVQAVALAYKRGDNGQDPPEWVIDDPNQRASAASAAHHLLSNIKHIPGSDSSGKIEAESLWIWLRQVRQLCAQYGRADIGDQCIGELLSRSPAEANGSWPCIAVCEAMEKVASQEIAAGFEVGTHNARGVHWRKEGGTRERELAAKYRNWAQTLSFDYPYVASILERIASAYDREAEWQDSETRVRRRLQN